MWLTNSSVGRKFVMAITGACLVLFVTFHAVMNGVALFWPSAYNMICAFLGANWYALIASMGLAFLFLLHIIYALVLTVENRRARGNDRYDVTSKPKQVEWASQNMLVLGIVVLAFLGLHLVQFWAKMQLAEICHTPYVDAELGTVAPQSGTLFIQLAFQNWWTPVCYIIGFVALWFHMNHGFWSMFQSAGWNNTTWLPRLKTVGCWWTTIVCGLFVAQAIVFTVQAHNGTLLECPALIEQYQEFNAELGAETADCCATPCTAPSEQPAACNGQGHCGRKADCAGNCDKAPECTGDCAGNCADTPECTGNCAECGKCESAQPAE